jgi:multiple sugar transport system permease protein
MGSSRVSKSKNALKKEFVNDLTGWLLVLPLLIGLGGFTLYPMIKSLSDSFYDYDGSMVRDFVGWSNYVNAFHDPLLGKSIGLTLLYSFVAVPLGMILSLLLALLLENKIKGVGFFRVIFYLPILIPATVFGMIAAQLFDPDYGVFNRILSLFGGHCEFFRAGNTSMMSFILLSLYGIGSNLLLWIASLKNVSRSYLEAAKIEGANYFHILFKIILPLCAPYIFYMLLTGLIGALQTFSMAYIMSSTGGADNSLLFIDIYIYNLSMGGGGRFGYASAVSWILFLLTAGFSILMFVFAKQLYYEDEKAK